MKIGIDIGGSHIAIATVNEKGKIVEKIEQDITPKENITQYMIDFVDKAIEKLSKTGDIKEIGIAVPGNPKGTSFTNLVNFEIEKIDFQFIQEKYNIPLKAINDGKAAALAEKRYGALRDTKDSVFLCLGTGIGGAVFLNNQLLQANCNPGFEIGHMIIDRNGIPCHCGKKGCFETYCSMKRLKNNIQNILKEIIPGKKIQNAKELKELLQENLENEEIQHILEEYINNLMIGLSNVIDIFEPEAICLGGSFVHFKDILYDRLISKMQERKYVFNKDFLPEIRLAKLGNDAGIVGATLI